jgi:hypothetical protein
MLTVTKRILRLLICFGLAARAMYCAGTSYDRPDLGGVHVSSIRQGVGLRHSASG